MGKGTIISGGENGLYNLQINYNREKYDKDVSYTNIAITALTNKINALDLTINELYIGLSGLTHEAWLIRRTEIDKQEALRAMYVARKLALNKHLDYMERLMPNDDIIQAYCVDLTEDLSGVVGTIEVPGEMTETVNIKPGYNGGSTWDEDEDKQLIPAVMQTPAQSFYNIAMFPGWQKWKPMYRYGTITNIVEDVADVDLNFAHSTQQTLNINQSASLSNVNIEYMSCNGSAFSEGDEVVVKFENQDWASPKIIGFKSNPKSCASSYIVIYTYFFGFIWNLNTNSLATELINPTTGIVFEYPASRYSLNLWMNAKTSKHIDYLWNWDFSIGDPKGHRGTSSNPLGGVDESTYKLGDNVLLYTTSPTYGWQLAYKTASKTYTYHITALNDRHYMIHSTYGSSNTNVPVEDGILVDYQEETIGQSLTLAFGSSPNWNSIDFNLIRNISYHYKTFKFNVSTPIGNFDEIETNYNDINEYPAPIVFNPDKYIFEISGMNESLKIPRLHKANGIADKFMAQLYVFEYFEMDGTIYDDGEIIEAETSKTCHVIAAVDFYPDEDALDKDPTKQLRNINFEIAIKNMVESTPSSEQTMAIGITYF